MCTAGPRCAKRAWRAFRTLPLTRRDLGAAGSADVRGGRGAEPAAGTRCRSPPASPPPEPSYPVYRRPLPRPCGSRTAAPAAAPRSARPSPRCFRGRSFPRRRGNRSTGQDPAQNEVEGPSTDRSRLGPPYSGASAAFWERSHSASSCRAQWHAPWLSRSSQARCPTSLRIGSDGATAGLRKLRLEPLGLTPAA